MSPHLCFFFPYDDDITTPASPHTSLLPLLRTSVLAMDRSVRRVVLETLASTLPGVVFFAAVAAGECSGGFNSTLH
jgi:hypothetical protein